jgi:cytochrome c-type biogenesis protein CcmH
MRRLVLALCLVVAAPVWAVQPHEMLDDPALEERAREISSGLRCLVCRNESIDESNAELAGDMRVLVRERILAGDSNAEVVDYIVDRYGEYVLLNPQTSGSNLLLWMAGPLMLGAALVVGGVYLRRRAATPEDEAASLDPEETERLREILKE